MDVTKSTSPAADWLITKLFGKNVFPDTVMLTYAALCTPLFPMPVLKIKVQHSLAPEEAAKRIKKRIAEEVEKQAQYVTELKENSIQPNRSEYSCKVYGFNLDGNFHAEPNQVAVEVNLPFAAMMMKGMIENQIQNALGDALKSDEAVA